MPDVGASVLNTMVQPIPKPTHKRKVEKVQKIQMQERRNCWVCSTTQNLEEHHVFSGANRQISEKYGLKVWLCHNDHNENIFSRPGIHYNKPLRMKLKQEAQRKFEEVYSRELFTELFKINYL